MFPVATPARCFASATAISRTAAGWPITREPRARAISTGVGAGVDGVDAATAAGEDGTLAGAAGGGRRLGSAMAKWIVAARRPRRPRACCAITRAPSARTISIEAPAGLC
jgi:hypothetical protein